MINYEIVNYIEELFEKESNNAIDVLIMDESEVSEFKDKNSAEFDVNFKCFCLCVKRAKIFLDIGEKKEEYKEILFQIINYAEEYISYIVNNKYELYSFICRVINIVSPEIKNDFIELYKIIERDFEIIELEDDTNIFSFIWGMASYYFEVNLCNDGVDLILSALQHLKDKFGDSSDVYYRGVIDCILVIYENNLEYATIVFEKNEDILDDYCDDTIAEIYWEIASYYEQIGNLERAGCIFYKCYQARKKCYGEDNWYTQMAKRGYAIIHSKNKTRKEDCDILCDFSRRCSRGDFDTQIDQGELYILEGISLCIALQYQIKNNSLDPKCIERYEKIALVYDDDSSCPYINLKLAFNYWGLYFYLVRDYLQAEDCFRRALSVTLNYDGGITDEEIKVNLLLVYNATNEIDYAMEVFDEFDIDDDGNILSLDKEMQYSVWNTICSMCIRWDELEVSDDIRSIIDPIIEEAYEKYVVNFDANAETSMMLIYASISMIFMVFERDASPKRYIELLKKYEEILTDTDCNSEIMFMLYDCLALITEEREYIDATIGYMDDEQIGISQKVCMYSDLLFMLAKLGDVKTAVYYSMKMCNIIEEIWHDYIKYANDYKILEILVLIEVPILKYYSIIRELEDIEVAYEYVLKFKSLASLIGKERNRVLQSSDIDADLLKRIRKLQNQNTEVIVDILNEDIQHNSTSELKELELIFSKQFPANGEFRSITTKEVKDRIPENAALFEYEIYNGWLDNKETEDYLRIDVYFLLKRNGNCSVSRRSIVDGTNVLEKAKQLSAINHKISDQAETIDDIEEKKSIDSYLFDMLIAPELNSIVDISQIFIAPCGELANISFGLLKVNSECRFGDNRFIIMIESGRDFLFNHPQDTETTGSLIIGNPLYKTRVREISNDNEASITRYSADDYTNVKSLPFSEMEADLVSRICKSNYYTGKNATKNILLNAKNVKNIHIATHGLYDLKEEYSSLYSAQLLFSGVSDIEIDDKSLGNGIVTADEISRLNLQDTNIVVLSSCLSGRNEAGFSNVFQGLISAFSAAGVKYIVSNLWLVDDFASVIFMNAFYYYYISKNKAPYIALHYAKNYLKNITVEQIRNTGYFRYIDEKLILNEETLAMIKRLEKRPNEYKPFSKERFWGGFICYQCY